MTTHPIKPFLLALYALPQGSALFAPEVVVEQDGDIGLDWQDKSNVVMSVSISEDGRVGWAALIHDYEAHGSWHMPGEVHPAFTESVRRYAEATA